MAKRIRPEEAADYILARIQHREDGCWIYTGSINDNGYGRVQISGRKLYVHQLSYELFVGPIPDGLEIDHTCHNKSDCSGGDSCRHRACFNPAHLEPTTHLINMLRGRGFGATNARKTHCPKGHPYNDANTYVDATGNRECRECIRLASARRRRERTGECSEPGCEKVVACRGMCHTHYIRWYRSQQRAVV